MSLSNPSELRKFLDSLGAKAKKSLSQNFLIDGNILNKIVEEAQVNENDFVIEVGPGPGALTQVLLSKKAHLLAIEKDSLFASQLSRLNVDNLLEVIEGDFLECDIESEIKKRIGEKKAKLVANLPYQLTTPILSKVIPLYHTFSSITVMVQEEVARRMVAKVNSENYSSLSLFLDFYSTAKYAFKVSNNCFFPVPKVQSAIVTLVLKKPPLEKNHEDFFRIVRTAFQHRRKMLRSSLKELYPVQKLMEAFKELNFKEQIRPENLSLNDFINLFLVLTSDRF